MNFLAHFHLAWPDEGLVAGGLEGDYYKGPLRGDLPQGLERGVRLHRAVDTYTDQHPLVIALRREFPPELRRYAGILIDLCFDHYLCKHWARFSATPLQEFTWEVYHLLARHEATLSRGSRNMLARMVEHDILGLYQSWDTVPASAARIGRRFRRSNPLLDVDGGLAGVRDALERCFLAFYPQVQAFTAFWEQNDAGGNPRSQVCTSGRKTLT